jgi:hypothetical protein
MQWRLPQLRMPSWPTLPSLKMQVHPNRATSWLCKRRCEFFTELANKPTNYCAIRKNGPTGCQMRPRVLFRFSWPRSFNSDRVSVFCNMPRQQRMEICHCLLTFSLVCCTFQRLSWCAWCIFFWVWFDIMLASPCPLQSNSQQGTPAEAFSLVVWCRNHAHQDSNSRLFLATPLHSCQ